MGARSPAAGSAAGALGAAGGAGGAEDFVTLFRALPKVDAGLAASIFHFGQVSIPELKRTLAAEGIPVRI